MSVPLPFRRTELKLALAFYRHVRHIVCGLGNAPCTQADIEQERACTELLVDEFGCQLVWPYNEPFDPSIYYRAVSLRGGPPNPLQAGAHRVGVVVVPEVIKKTGWIAAHAVVEPVPGYPRCVR